MTASAVEVLRADVVGAALHAVRLIPVTLLCPFLGGPAVPAVVRVGLAAALGASAYAGTGAPAASVAPLAMVAALARELATGLVLAFVATVPFDAARGAGRLVDTLRGATLSELHVSPLRQRESACGDLLSHWAIVLAASAGGDRLVVGALLGSFHAIPAGGAMPRLGAEAVLTAGAELLGCAVALSAPAAAGLVAADLALAAATRFSPLLGVAPVLQPARAAVGVLAVAVPAALVAGRMTSAVATSAAVIRIFSGAGP